jgi:hypothetical protein
MLKWPRVHGYFRESLKHKRELSIRLVSLQLTFDQNSPILEGGSALTKNTQKPFKNIEIL